MEKDDEFHDPFEERLRLLRPQAASPELKERIARGLGARDSRSKLRIGIVAVASLAVTVLAAAWWIESKAVFSEKGHTHAISVGHQQILLEASEPVFIEIPGRGPMWRIDLKLQNRFFVDTPEGMKSSNFLAENRTVLVPVVYQ